MFFLNVLAFMGFLRNPKNFRFCLAICRYEAYNESREGTFRLFSPMMGLS